MRSIISNEKQCVVCGRGGNLHRHHVFYGRANRKLSEKYGCWVYLCPEHHNMSNNGVHFNHDLDLRLKRQCQEAWQEINGTQEDFMKVFGRNYL